MADRDLLKKFVDALQQLRKDAGTPSFERLEQLTRDAEWPLRHTATHERLRGQRLVEWEFVKTFVAACVRHAELEGRSLAKESSDLGKWKKSHGEMVAEVEEGRDQARLADAARKEMSRRKALLEAAEPRPVEDINADAGEVGHVRSYGTLLRPDRGVTRFMGREVELEALQTWCHDLSACPVRLVTGAGGVGKTRLALELADRLEAEAWEWIKVNPQREVDAACAAVDLGRQVLLIVDYAETRPGLSQMLDAIARQRADGRTAGLRVLLVARATGEWWQLLLAGTPAVRELLDPSPMVLAAELAPGLNPQQVVLEAIPRFAAELQMPEPVISEVLAPAGKQLPTLVLHATALVGVLEAGEDVPTEERAAADLDVRPGARVVANMEVLERLLGHERRLWVHSAALASVTGTPTLLSEVVATLALLGPQDRGEATAALRRIPDLADANEERFGAIIRWARGLYPGQDGRWLEPLRPDLLAEHHVVRQLSESREFASRCLSGLDTGQAIRVLRVLTLARVHAADSATRLITDALRADLAGLAVPAVVVAVQGSPQLGQLLADVLGEILLPSVKLEEIMASIPSPSIALREVELVVVGRLRELQPSSSPPQEVADLAARYVHSLGELGRWEESLAAAEEAVGIYKRLAQENQGQFKEELAGSLINLAKALATGHFRFQEALEVTDEAIAIGREQALIRPDPFRHILAVALTSRAGFLSEKEGQLGSAIAAARQAITICRNLEKDQPGIFLDELANALYNLGKALSADGQNEGALQAASEAVEICAKLAQKRPDAFLPSFAKSLVGLAYAMARFGDLEQSIAELRKAASIYRMLAEKYPDAFLPNLADTLEKEAMVIVERSGAVDEGRMRDAVAVLHELNSYLLELTKSRPKIFSRRLAENLFRCGVLLLKLRDYTIAEAAALRAIQIAEECGAHDVADVARLLLGEVIRSGGPGNGEISDCL